MKITPTQTRAMIPIQVESMHGAPVRVVENQQGAFIVDLKRDPQGVYRTQFWVEREGLYRVEQDTPQGLVSVPLKVDPQVYLPFFSEFGLFSFLLSLILAVIFLWIRRRQKCAA